ncbi:PREDICTED: thrombospondin type-1 domain-containing protein 7A-like [Acropora digitifera]|uniref:thrombospondin type-1 domain-containing protein 7A-like n=1 Tax=Acropora digitifera TaxID=70779 RepID=UPI00077A7DC5|nr:PREDICTED: thrombospondin type-1 domain-containing protein 7A-like [Acropora digitifera]
MHSPENAAVLVLLVLVVDIQYSGASGRPRRCPVVNCSVSDWSPWSSCNSSMSEHEGSESRSRSITTTPSCGGKVCPLNLQESRLCYGSTAQNSYSEGNTKSGISRTIKIGASVGSGILFLIISLVVCCWCTSCHDTHCASTNELVCNVCNCKTKIHPSPRALNSETNYPTCNFDLATIPPIP